MWNSVQTKQGDRYICWRKWRGVPVFRIYSPSCRAMGSYSQALGRICKGRWKFLETPRGTFPSFSTGLYFENKLSEDVLRHRETKRLSQESIQPGVWSWQYHCILLTWGTLGSPPTDTLLCTGSCVSLNSLAPWGNSLASENSSQGRRMQRIWLPPAVIRKSSNYSALPNVRGRKEHVNRGEFWPVLARASPSEVCHLPTLGPG